MLEHQLREEFNRWAEAGRGDEMEQSHLPIVEPMLALIEFKPQDKVLDVGCGTGWLVRRIAPLVSAGLGGGNGCLRCHAGAGGVAERPTAQCRLRARGSGCDSLGERLLYQGPLRRVRLLLARPRARPPRNLPSALTGRLGLDSHQLLPRQSALPPMGRVVEGADPFVLRRRSGQSFSGKRDSTTVANRRIPDRSPTADVYTGRWFRDAEQMRNFKQEGALLLHARR